MTAPKNFKNPPRHSPLKWDKNRGCWWARVPRLTPKAPNTRNKGSRKHNFYGNHDDAVKKYYARLAGEVVVKGKPKVEAGEPKVLSGLSVPALREQYVAHKKVLVERGEFKPKSYLAMLDETKKFAKFCPGLVSGLTSKDFEKFLQTISQNVNTRGRNIRQVRAMFNWAADHQEGGGLIPQLPKWGGLFKVPPKKAFRQHRNKTRKDNGSQLWTGPEIQQLLAASKGNAGARISAMVLLGLNAGLRNGDLGELSLKHIDLETGFLDFPRVKNSEERQAFLWPRTITAIKSWIAVRPEAIRPEYQGLVFLSDTGLPICRNEYNAETDKTSGYDAIPHLFANLRTKAGLGKSEDGKITTVKEFGWLRNTTKTYGQNTGDSEAVEIVMGHETGSVRRGYLEKLDGKYLASPERLKAVADAIHVAVFGEKAF